MMHVNRVTLLQTIAKLWCIKLCAIFLDHSVHICTSVWFLLYAGRIYQWEL